MTHGFLDPSAFPENLVLFFFSKLPASKITFDFGFRMFCFYYVVQSVKIGSADMQLHYVQICVEMCFGNIFTSALHQACRLK